MGRSEEEIAGLGMGSGITNDGIQPDKWAGERGGPGQGRPQGKRIDEQARFGIAGSMLPMNAVLHGTATGVRV